MQREKFQLRFGGAEPRELLVVNELVLPKTGVPLYGALYDEIDVTKGSIVARRVSDFVELVPGQATRMVRPPQPPLWKQGWLRARGLHRLLVVGTNKDVGGPMGGELTNPRNDPAILSFIVDNMASPIMLVAYHAVTAPSPFVPQVLPMRLSGLQWVDGARALKWNGLDVGMTRVDWRFRAVPARQRSYFYSIHTPTQFETEHDSPGGAPTTGGRSGDPLNFRNFCC